ncbi:MAG: TSUP family transporter [Thermodesulfobacteriota bacterium]
MCWPWPASACSCRPPAEVESADTPPLKKAVGGIVIGVCIGLMGGLLGIGGGVFVVPLLIYALRTPTIAAASSTFIVCFSSLTGFLVYASVADIDWMFILPAAASSTDQNEQVNLYMMISTPSRKEVIK